MTNRLLASVYRRDIAAGWPTVAVVIPVRNGARHLADAVASILDQPYPRPLQICLAVGPSSDDTEAVAQRLAASDDRVVVVPNPSGRTPCALNAAIAATTSDIVVRVDAHSALSAGYVRRAVETMISTGAVNVGGVQMPEGQTRFQRVVGEVMSSRLGSGGARFHTGGAAGEVDTVYLGVFDRAAGDAVGWYDVRLTRNQDYELNIRLREAGGTIWFDPSLRASYRPRSTWRGLASQYFQYGFWKSYVLRLHPHSLRARQAVPAALPVVLALSILTPRRWRLRWLPLGYAATLVAGAPRRSRFLGAAILATQQLSWGIGFFIGVWKAPHESESGRCASVPEAAPSDHAS